MMTPSPNGARWPEPSLSRTQGVQVASGRLHRLRPAVAATGRVRPRPAGHRAGRRRRIPGDRPCPRAARHHPAVRRKATMATTTGCTAESKAEQAGDSTSLEWLARGGLVAYGVVHLLVGWLALQIARGTSSGTSADTSGALTTLAQQPFGKVLLWVVAVGLVALAL